MKPENLFAVVVILMLILWMAAGLLLPAALAKWCWLYLIA